MKLVNLLDFKPEKLSIKTENDLMIIIKFNDDNNKNNITKERSHYSCIPAIDIDSVLKIDHKRAYPQAYLEQCKYKLKKRKIVNYIDDEIIDEDSHLNFSVPDSYVEM